MTEERKAQLLGVLKANPFMQLLKLEISELSAEKSVGHMPYQEALANPYQSMHGGILYSMADIVSGFAACAGEQWASTLTGNMNYIRPATIGSEITCTATAIRRGRNIAVYHVVLTDDDQNVLQEGTFNFYLMEKLPE